MSEEGQGAATQEKLPVAEGGAPPHEATSLHDASTEVSQTNITQMTGCGAAPTESSKWCCEACTYENYPLSRKCTMCRTPKPALNEDIFKLQDGASALPAPLDATDAESLSERLKPVHISSVSPPHTHPPPGHSGSNKWPCPTCTYENWARAARCAMCGAEGGAPGGAGAAPPPSPADRLWLQACRGVVEGEARAVEAYLAAGGEAARALTPQEARALDRASAFDAGYTLVHLAIRFRRQEILSALLSRISGGGSGIKRSPSYVAPDLAAAIRRHLAGSVRYKKGPFPCRYINEFTTFSLPCEIEELESGVRRQLYSEVVDEEAQETLAGAGGDLQWSAACGAPLHALWNRSAGDCLPDAVCQAACGVFDRDNTLRAALADTLRAAHRALYARWHAWERAQAARLHYAPEEAQLRAEWARLVAAAAAPGTPLHQLHVWVLAHVMRRPLVVYGVDVVTSFRGEPLGYARLRGVYLPLLWEPGFCSAAPLCLGYTRGHFSALVPAERRGGGAAPLPLTDAGGELLPVPFLSAEEAADAEGVVRRWTRAADSRAGVLLARQALRPRPLLHAQLLEEWLNRYRRLQQDARAPDRDLGA